MLQRLGTALYWIALLLAIGPILGIFNVSNVTDKYFFGVIAFIILFIGWVLRFILNGRRDLIP